MQCCQGPFVFRPAVATIVGLIVCCTGVVVGAEGFEVDRTSWSGTVDDGAEIVVDNPFGEVRARNGGNAGAVELLATLQHFADEGPRLEMVAEQSADGTVVARVGWRDDDGRLRQDHDPGQRKRADMVVFVPVQASVEIHAGPDLVKLKGLRSSARITTIDGDIEVLAMAGDLVATSERGDVFARLEPGGSRGHCVLETGGAVELIVRQNDDLQIVVDSALPVITDVSLELERRADPESGEVRRVGSARLGDGSRVIQMTSRDDAVRLRLAMAPYDSVPAAHD